MPTILLLIALLAAGHVEATDLCSKNLDLLFAVDGSSTVCNGNEPCPRWDAIIQFCKEIVNALTIGKDYTRVAFVTYSNTTTVEWDLEKYTDKSSVISAIDNVKYPGGELVDALSLKVILNVFSPLTGDRLDVQNIGILISDGTPLSPDWVYALKSEALQLNRVGVFVVCERPGCTEPYALGIAAPPKKVNETYFLIDDYLSIFDVRDIVVKKFCAYKTIDQVLLGR